MKTFRPSALTAIRLIVASVFLAVGRGPAHAQKQVYSQPWDGSGNLFASQNDTSSGGFGPFATAYDNFTLAATSTVTQAAWVGGYFNTASQAPISGFTLTFWSDNAGQPGSPLKTESIAGTANETFMADTGGSAVYSYSATLPTPFKATADTHYWLSVVPDLSYPPQWGWATGTGGDGVSYNDFFGSRTQAPGDLAFTLKGSSIIPEASTMIGFGGLVLGGLLFLRRRR